MTQQELEQFAFRHGAISQSQVASIIGAAVRFGDDAEDVVKRLKGERPDLFMVVDPGGRARRHESKRQKGRTDHILKRAKA